MQKDNICVRIYPVVESISQSDTKSVITLGLIVTSRSAARGSCVYL